MSTPSAAPRSSGRSRITTLAARGNPFVWLTGSGLAIASLMIGALLLLVVVNGARTFWPAPVLELELRDGSRVLGEVTRSELDRSATTQGGRRRLLRTGNFDLYGDDFRWVSDADVASESRPDDAWWVERLEWGPAVGSLEAVLRDGEPLVQGAEALERDFPRLLREATARRARIRAIERNQVGEVNYRLERSRLRVRKALLEHGEGSPEHAEAGRAAAEAELELGAEHARLGAEIAKIRAEDERYRVVMREVGGRLVPERPALPDTGLLVSQIVRAYPANRLDLLDKLRVYASRWKEFLVEEPREANTEGGVFPAIFGTLMMTLIMSLAVAPFGVVAALYVREYARQGLAVSFVRVAVNNLAGVPSIVFGVFGLGFFCYALGGSIDQLFFAERLPAPTYGTGGILWASLTLALLTVPVVIVATEEALAAVPRSQREGSLACGASKWQTIRRIVLPSATPGIMTGLILAMARGAGEVAPLMITGVVKLAPELPFDGHAPFLHLERSFMHLGFHIFDVGFQSRNSEAGKPMVFTTTLLLIALVVLLNLTAIRLRNRLRQRYRTGGF